MAIVLSGVLALSLSACTLGALLPDDTESATKIETALYDAELGVVSARATSTVSGFDRKMSVRVEITEATYAEELMLDLLEIVADNTPALTHGAISLRVRNEEGTLTPPISGPNARWSERHESMLFSEGVAESLTPEISLSLQNLNTFLEEEGR
ncbi:MAG TPA: hypothetical protein PK781_09565 [Terrimesophilobacter sp.]|nr:hypothetical protein [Terrimesophilobacter sp.]HRQ00693.1 hypothetical protein [Terrimesophilobacter sp.]